MSKASAISDLVRALAVLRPTTDEARSAIAGLLGFKQPVPAESGGDPQKVRPYSIPPEVQFGTPALAPSTVSRTPNTVSDRSPGRELSATLTLIHSSPPQPPDWLDHVILLPAPSADPMPPPKPAPLLLPQWTRSIVAGALSTSGGNGPLDPERLVRSISRGLPLLHLPRRLRPTLARGAQVLVDLNDAMLPFAADQDWLVNQVQTVVGKEKVQILQFAGCPSWGAGPGSKLRWKSYHEHYTPPRGVPVLLLTDLGIGKAGFGNGTATLADWREFAHWLRKSGCPAVAFVPYKSSRWPLGLLSHFHLLYWDRSTSVRTIRRSLGRMLLIAGEKHR